MPAIRKLLLLTSMPFVLSACESMDLFAGDDTSKLRDEVETLYKGVEELEGNITDMKSKYSRMKVERDDLAQRLSKYETVEIKVKDDEQGDMKPVGGDDTMASDAALDKATMNSSDTMNKPAPASDLGNSLSFMMGGQFAAHIASYKSPQSAQEGWHGIQEKYPNAFRGAQARIKSLNLPNLGGVFYRLKIGPFQSAATATEACNQLKTIDMYCKVAPFDGDLLQ